jgi:TraL protein
MATFWKLSRSAAVLVALVATSTAHAGCRSGDAAVRGSQLGFERAQTSAVSISQNETQAQTLLQKCIAGLASMQTISMFPSMGDIMNQMVQRVCNAATQQVNSAIGQVTPQNDLDAIMGQLNSEAQKQTGGLITNPITQTPISTVTSPSSQPSTKPQLGPDFWSGIWK